MYIEFTVPGKPVGKARPRVTRHGTYTPKTTLEYEAKVREAWDATGAEMAPGGVPVFVEIHAWFPVPKSTSKQKARLMENTFYLKKPDADNVAKSILDALNGRAWSDDSVVQLSTVNKLYTIQEPRVDIYITVEEDEHEEETDTDARLG